MKPSALPIELSTQSATQSATELSSECSAFHAARQQLHYYLAGFGCPDIALQSYQPQPLDAPPDRPAISAAVLLLPAQYLAIDCGSADDANGADGAAIYRAAAAHAVAHLRHSRRHHPAAKRKPMLLAILALIEDARVERLMLRQYPGLQALWGRFHVASGEAGDLTLASLAARLARALHDPSYVDQNHWVNKGRALFEKSSGRLDDAALFEDVGKILANDLGQMRVPFDLEHYRVEPAYRDDNTLLWDFDSDAEHTPPDEMLARAAAEFEPGSGDTKDGAGSGKQADAAVDPAVDPNIVMPAPETVQQSVHNYVEWDYRAEIEREKWVTLFETAPVQLDPGLAEYTPDTARQSSRMAQDLPALMLDRSQLLRRQHEGDELDLNAVVESRISMRGKLAPDPRIFQKPGRRQRRLAILLLLDLSQSSNDRIEEHPENSCENSRITILELEKQAAQFVAQAFQHSSQRIAVHGFASNGRSAVHYARIKDFDEPFGARQQHRLALQAAALSTRMGAALRHAGTHLAAQPGDQKILFLLTDGAPSDIDVFDSRYLIEDARHAVARLAAQGVVTFCLTLDKRADAYVRAIFGAWNYLIVDNAATLPQQVARALAKLAAR